MRTTALLLAVLLASPSVRAEPKPGSLERLSRPEKRGKGVLIGGGISMGVGTVGFLIGVFAAGSPAPQGFASLGSEGIARGGVILGWLAGGGSFLLMGAIMLFVERMRFGRTPSRDSLEPAREDTELTALPTFTPKPLPLPVFGDARPGEAVSY